MGVAAVALSFKLLCQWGFERLGFDALVAYSLVHIAVFFLSYFLHVGFTFKQKHSWHSLKVYFKTVLGFKVLDYFVFAVVFTSFEVSSKLAIVLATGILFLLRFSVLRLRFSPSEPQK